VLLLRVLAVVPTARRPGVLRHGVLAGIQAGTGIAPPLRRWAQGRGRGWWAVVFEQGELGNRQNSRTQLFTAMHCQRLDRGQSGGTARSNRRRNHPGACPWLGAVIQVAG